MYLAEIYRMQILKKVEGPGMNKYSFKKYEPFEMASLVFYLCV